jgi:hypothetical protein
LTGRAFALCAKLLTDDAIIRTFLFEQRTDRGFSGPISQSNGACIALGLKPKVLSIIGADRIASRIGQAVNQLNIIRGN